MIAGWTVLTIGAFAALGGCSSGPQAPGAANVQWDVKRTPDSAGYRLVGRADLKRTANGWYQPTLTLVDQRGCRNVVELHETQMVDAEARGAAPVTFDQVAHLKWPVATAEFAIQFHEVPFGSLDPRSITRTGVFHDQRVLDASIRVPEMPENACGKSAGELKAGRKERLRKQAKTDPDGADASAVADMSRNEVLATAINTAGFLCARVRDAYPTSGGMIVNCTEYRSGRGRAKYKIDTSAMEVTKLN